MSVFTQFVGNTPPFGQLVGLWDGRNNPTIDGVEYLKTGVIKAISGYSTLATNWPSYALNVQPGTAYSFTSSNGAINFYLTDGTRYYAFNSSIAPRYGTSVTSALSSVVSSGNAATDACRFGTSATLISVNSGNAAQNQYVVGTTATAVSTTVAMNVVASNTAGTLAVMANGNSAAANYIWTSTNGTTWTSRTPAGGGATGTDTFARAMWSPVGNCFIYFGNTTSTVYTSTDGFTLTSIGTPTGLSAVASSSTGTGNNKFCASSASSTLFSVVQSSIGYIVKTTNGTSYTATPVTSLFDGVAANSTATLVYVNSAYYAIFASTFRSPTGSIFKSTDEGATWTKVPTVFLTPYVTASGTSSYVLDYLALMNGNIMAFVWGSGVGNGYYGVLSSYDTATHIGLPYASTQLAGSDANNANSPNYYIRIK